MLAYRDSQASATIMTKHDDKRRGKPRLFCCVLSLAKVECPFPRKGRCEHAFSWIFGTPASEQLREQYPFYTAGHRYGWR